MPGQEARPVNSEIRVDWTDDSELFEVCRTQLYSAVLGDVMDAMGYRYQFLPPEIQPIHQDTLLAGRAMPVLTVEDRGGEESGRMNESLSQPFGLMLKALDDLRPNEVYICSGASPRYALWGELMTTCALNRGAAGAVLNGYHRDTRGILASGFPTFSRGRYAQDQRPRGKVVDFRCSIEIESTRIRPGDMIFGDLEGVCVIPSEIERAVLEAAWEKAHGERKVFDAIKAGMGAQESWDRFGIM